MTRLIWNAPPQLESGLDRGIVFPPSGAGVPWYGLIRVDEILEGSEAETIYIDGEEVGQTDPVEDFSAVVEAFTYPEIVDHRDYVFGFSYRTNVTMNGAYLLHLVYNATFEVPDQDSTTLTETIDPTNFIFGLKTTPVTARKVRPFAHLVIDSDILHPLQMEEIEDHLYGTDETDPTMPDPIWIMELLNTWTFGYGHGPYGHLPYGGHT